MFFLLTQKKIKVGPYTLRQENLAVIKGNGNIIIISRYVKENG